MSRTAVACALLVAFVTLAGCADDADDGSGAPTPSASPSDSASVSASVSGSVSSSSTSTSTAPRPAQTFQVDIQGNQFKDGTKTIQKGDTLQWTQKDSTTHTVTSDDGTSFDSGNMLSIGPTSTFSHKFDAVGEFAYHCEVHASMTAKITVVAALPA